MDWPKTRVEFAVKDREALKYSAKGEECKVVRALVSDRRPLVWRLDNDETWSEWFTKDHFSKASVFEPGIVLILSGRKLDEQEQKSIVDSADDFDDEAHNPALLTYLTFSRAIFDLIIESFHVHGSIARALTRSQAMFARTFINQGQNGEAIVYNCRTSNDWPGDLALSVTWYPETGLSYAVFYGCEDDTMVKIHGRLVNSEETLTHPLLLPGILSELERRRQIDLVRKWLTKLNKTVSELSRTGTDYDTIFPARSADRAIDPWIKVHYLKIGLENWRDQILKMIDHIDELATKYFAASPTNAEAATTDQESEEQSEEDAKTKSEESRKETLRRTGTRIKDRLNEIIADYNENIRECVLIMEGMNLATQLAHTKANMDIAIGTKLDGSQMKWIALLTGFFLPSTFVATLFSMTFFSWDAEAGEAVVSPYVWIYFAVAGALSLFTVGSYLWWSSRSKNKSDGYTALV